MRKLVFLLLFTAAHALLTLAAVGQVYNPLPGLTGAGWSLARIVLTLPLLLPLMHLDPDGDRSPRWLQYASLGVNSAIWGLAIVGVWTAIQWICLQVAARGHPNRE